MCVFPHPDAHFPPALIFSWHKLRSDEYDVTLLEAGPSVGGLVAGWKTQGKEKQGEGGDETMKAGGGEVRQDDRLIDFFQAKDRRIHFFHVKEDHPH